MRSSRPIIRSAGCRPLMEVTATTPGLAQANGQSVLHGACARLDGGIGGGLLDTA